MSKLKNQPSGINHQSSRLSAVLATYNEEKNIGDCLETVRQLADEIVVVDGSSTDRTREIARKHGAKVIKTSNPLNFHINKNKAIDAASGDWILQLDADERVTPELANEIKKAIQKPSLDGYWLPRKNYFLGRFLKKGGQYPDYTLRLYRKGKGRLPAKDVHEQAEVRGKVGYLKSELLHYRDTSFKKYLAGLGRYTTILAEQMREENLSKNPFELIDYLLVKPAWWFLKAYFRHKGFVDGWQGFVFALFSSFRFPIAYLKYLKAK